MSRTRGMVRLLLPLHLRGFSFCDRLGTNHLRALYR